MLDQASKFPALKVCFTFSLMIGCALNAFAQTPTPTATPTPQPSPTTQSVPQKQSPASGGIKILSDTKGVDFRDYMKKFRFTVQSHWEPLIPKVAMPPIQKYGRTVIEIEVAKDGKVANMKLEKSSDDVNLDRAAWGALITAVPFPALPAQFSGESLKLRCSFVYNPLNAPATTEQEKQPPVAPQH